MKHFQEGKEVFFVANSILVKRATIVRRQGDRCILRFKSGTGISLPENWLFHTLQEAEESVNRRKQQIKGNRNPHAWGT